MKQTHRQFSLLWGLLLLITMVSAVFATWRLRDLPMLPVTLGPELHVRSVLASQTPGAGPFQRDDRVVALRGRALEDLRELRASLDTLDDEPLSDVPLAANTDTHTHAPRYTVNYQIVRPLHRFNLPLRGEPIEPGALPAGVEEGDQLVELDGRPMKPRVRSEGLRSIISSRPEALLVFERPNAVFTGEVELELDPYSEEIIASFLLCLFLVVAFWRKGHASLSAWTPLATGLQTLAFAWSSLFIFEYQWVLADYSLVYLVIFAMIMTGPLGIFARTASAEDGGSRKWGSLAIGVVGALVVIVALKAGRFQNPEVALQFAAFLGTLFVLFEVILTGLNEGAGVLLGERSKFLSFIVFAILLASLIAYMVEPIDFVEQRWRWFVVIVLGLVWIGDVQLCLSGLPKPAMADIASSLDRHSRVRELIEHIGALAPTLDIMIVVSHQNSSLTFGMNESELVISPTTKELGDAAGILFDEDVRLPSMGLQEGDELAQGFAETMQLALAMPLYPPTHGVDAEDVCVMVMGRHRVDPESEELVWASTLDPGLLDYVPGQVTTERWAALMIESLLHQPVGGSTQVSELVEELDAQRVERVNAPVDPALEQDLTRARRDVALLEHELEQMQLYYNPAPALPATFETLLEVELLEALSFLFEDGGEPIVLSGAAGVGKTFVAAAGHMIEGHRSGRCVVFDAALYSDEDLAEALLGEGHDEEFGVLELCREGSVIVEHAEVLSSGLLMQVSERSEALDVRLYLCMEHPGAERSSLLEDFGASIMELLSHRELVIPRLRRRKTLRVQIIEHWLETLAWQKGYDDLKIAPAAHHALLTYEWPGDIDEVVLLIDIMLSGLDRGVFEVESLHPCFDGVLASQE